MRAALSWGLFGVGYLASWFLTTVLPVPLLWYYPAERRWALARVPDGLAADFYGRTLVSLLAGAAGLLVMRALLRRARPEREARWLRLVWVWNLGLLILDVSLYVFMLSRRHPLPAALPADAGSR